MSATLVHPQNRRASSYEPRDPASLSHRLRGLFAISGAKRSLPRRLSRPDHDASSPTERSCRSRNVQNLEYKGLDSFGECSNSSQYEEDVPPSPSHLLVSRNYSISATPSPKRQLFRASISPDTIERQSSKACEIALSLPEIVENILQRLDDDHWAVNSSILTRKTPKIEGPSTGTTTLLQGPLNQCLLVNRTFSDASVRVLSRKVELSSLDQLDAYTQTNASQDNYCRDLLLHRLKTCSQERLDSIKQHRLRSLELYVCPNLVPSIQMISSGTLRKIALPGCGLVDDLTMQSIAIHCKWLEILDLRACEQVTDRGLIEIAHHCPNLNYLNVGRVKNGCSVTDASIIEISKHTSVETLGLAGCAVGDPAVLAIAEYRGTKVERLSMNQCHNISDVSIQPLLACSGKLQVLEIVGCKLVRDARTLCYFKVQSGALVETDQVLAAQMLLYEADALQALENNTRRSRRSQRRIVTT